MNDVAISYMTMTDSVELEDCGLLQFEYTTRCSGCSRSIKSGLVMFVHYFPPSRFYQ